MSGPVFCKCIVSSSTFLQFESKGKTQIPKMFVFESSLLKNICIGCLNKPLFITARIKAHRRSNSQISVVVKAYTDSRGNKESVGWVIRWSDVRTWNYNNFFRRSVSRPNTMFVKNICIDFQSWPQLIFKI